MLSEAVALGAGEGFGVQDGDVKNVEERCKAFILLELGNGRNERIMLPQGVERRGWRVALLYTLALEYLMCCPRIVPPQQFALARVDGPHEGQNGWRYLTELAEDGSPTDAVIRAALLQEFKVRVPTLQSAPQGAAA